MMPFEPKTDSKEFGITNLQPVSTAKSATSEAADLTIRIWLQNSNAGTAALTWNSESVLVYMIADLVAASHGRTAVDMPAAMAAHFDNSLHALVAARRIQTAILEFLACRPGDCLGAALLIHRPIGPGYSLGTAQSALRLAEPGQIMLSGDVSNRFRDLPGIDLRAVPGLTTGGTEHAGLSELIWTSAERLANLRNTAPGAAPTANVGSPFGATMIVNAPVAETPRKAASTLARPLEGSDTPHTRTRRPSAPAGSTNREETFDQGLAEFEEHRSFFTRSRLIIGAVALGLLLVVGLVLYHPGSSSSVQPKRPAYETPTGERKSSPTEPPVSSVPQGPAVVEPAPGSHPKTQPAIAKAPVIKKPPDKTAKDNDNKDKEKPKKAEDVPIVNFEGNSTYDGMTQKDIPRLLQWARSDAGNGNYAKAAQEYRVILQLQPGNPDAKEGLRKIGVAQGLDQ